jgi:hypothetical protein
MPPTDELAAYQAALLALLAQDLPPEAMQLRLREDAAFAGFQAYVQGFEPRMLAVAVELVKKWGRRGKPGSVSAAMPSGNGTRRWE